MSEHVKRSEAIGATPRKPSLIAYSVKLNGEDEAIWTRIGAAWPHRKGPGFSIQLDALPLEGRIVLVTPAVDPKQAANDA